MNVVVVCDVGKIDGGAVKVAVSTAIELGRRGHRVIFFAGTGLGDDFQGTEVDARSLNLQKFTEIAGLAGKLRKLLARGSIVDALRKALSGLDPADTVVHAHLYLSVIPGRALTAAADMGFKCILTCHDYMPACPNANFYNFRSREICRLRPFSARCWTSECTARGPATKAVRMVRSGTDRFVDKTWKRWSRIAYVSDFSRRILEPYLGDASRGVVLYNPCDVAKGERVDAARNRFGTWMGRMVEEKDPLAFAQAAAASQTPAMLIGDGPLLEAVRSANPDAECPGWVSAEGVNGLLGEARFLAMTSRWYETAGLVAIEALARGIPVVVPDTCAACEFVDDGETGLIYRTASPDGLSRALRAMRDDATVDRMSQRGYEKYWATPLDMARHIAQLEGLYRDALSSAN